MNSISGGRIFSQCTASNNFYDDSDPLILPPPFYQTPALFPAPKIPFGPPAPTFFQQEQYCLKMEMLLGQQMKDVQKQIADLAVKNEFQNPSSSPLPLNTAQFNRGAGSTEGNVGGVERTALRSIEDNHDTNNNPAKSTAAVLNSSQTPNLLQISSSQKLLQHYPFPPIACPSFPTNTTTSFFLPNPTPVTPIFPIGALNEPCWINNDHNNQTTQGQTSSCQKTKNIDDDEQKPTFPPADDDSPFSAINQNFASKMTDLMPHLQHRRSSMQTTTTTTSQGTAGFFNADGDLTYSELKERYLKRREKNNIAVRRNRLRRKREETSKLEKIKLLISRNDQLRKQLTILELHLKFVMGDK